MAKMVLRGVSTNLTGDGEMREGVADGLEEAGDGWREDVDRREGALVRLTDVDEDPVRRVRLRTLQRRRVHRVERAA